jgi:uncharacterized protein (TIGR03435 family)
MTRHLMATAALCVALGAIVPAEFQVSSDPRFEVASIKPNRSDDGRISISSQNGTFRATGVTLGVLLRNAYRVQEFQIANGPRWIDADRFDIIAKEPDGGERSGPRGPGPTRQQLMLRGLLAERFNLAVHNETRQLPVFALVLARRDGRLGPQLRPSAVDCATPPAAAPGVLPSCSTSVAPGAIAARSRTIAQLADALSTLTNTGSSLDRPIIDRSGLTGNFDVDLQFTPERIPGAGPGGPPQGAPPIDPDGASIFTAIQEQLGLKLDPQRGPVEVLVIDRVERPTAD